MMTHTKLSHANVTFRVPRSITSPAGVPIFFKMDFGCCSFNGNVSRHAIPRYCRIIQLSNPLSRDNKVWVLATFVRATTARIRKPLVANCTSKPAQRFDVA